MSVRNINKEVLQRLESKTLDAQFLATIQHGLSCSPFESEAILDVVKEVYFPFLDQASGSAPPGKITLVAVCADEPAGKPVADCLKRTLCLTLHRGSLDDRLLRTRGAPAFRQARIPDLCQEALSQGALLTREDLAYRVFFTSTRTISRDLAALRKKDPSMVIPLRSTIHDIGPVLTHRVQIIRLALEGKTTSEICQMVHHSPQAVANYISTFTRCAQLAQRNFQVGQIAFLLHRGEGLIRAYLDLLKLCQKENILSYHLNELLTIGRAKGEKNRVRRSSHGN